MRTSEQRDTNRTDGTRDDSNKTTTAIKAKTTTTTQIERQTPENRLQHSRLIFLKTKLPPFYSARFTLLSFLSI